MNRRVIAVALVVVSLVLAGCGGAEPPSAAEQEYEDSMGDVGHRQSLRAGESMGVDQGDEHWQILVTDVSDEYVNVTMRKIVADEVGQNKEGIDPTYTFNRSFVGVGDMEFIEENMKVGVVGIEDGEAAVVYGDWALNPEDVSRIAEYEAGNSSQS